MEPATPAEEIIDFIAAGTSPEAVISFRPSASMQRRVEELVERRKEDQLSPAEGSELEEYLYLEHLMIMAKARARLRLARGE